jgi:hypothetical protein
MSSPYRTRLRQLAKLETYSFKSLIVGNPTTLLTGIFFTI